MNGLKDSNSLSVCRLRVITSIFGFIFSMSLIAGYMLTHRGTLKNMDGRGYLAVVALTALSAVIFELLLRTVQRFRERSAEESSVSGKRVFFFWWCFILISYIPVFLAYYPGIFAYDVSWQIPQFVNKEFNTHHPIMHTFLLGICYRIGHTAGWASQGIVLYSAIQMTAMSAVFAYCIKVLSGLGLKIKGRVLAGLFYAWLPFHSVLAVSTTKDVLFSGLCLLFACFLLENMNRKKIELWKKAVFIVLIVFMLLFRSNAPYAFLLAVPFIILLLKDNWKRWLVLLFAGMLLFFTADKCLTVMLKAEKASIREMLGVPIQQLARTENQYLKELEPEQAQQLEFFIPPRVAAKYDPYRADMVKFGIDVSIEQNLDSFIGIWTQLFGKYPLTYLEAFLQNSQGFWYLYDTSHANIYRIKGYGYLLTNHVRLQDFLEDTPGVKSKSYFPALKRGMEKLVTNNAYWKIPVLRLLFSPALYFWLHMFYFMYALWTKQYRLLTIAVYPMAVWLTCLLGPCALIRYAYPYVVSAPVLITAAIYLKTDVPR